MDGKIQTRIAMDVQLAFDTKCASMNRKPNDVIREMVSAFNDDRLTITQTEAERGLYDNRKES